MKRKKTTVLLAIALFGLIFPNGLFLYWLIFEYESAAGVVRNKLAIAFMTDAFLALALLSYSFARNPIGKIRWHWFVALSLIGGLGFSLPFYWWLSERTRAK